MIWLPGEQWADVPGFEGTYWVSTEGRVLSRRRHRSPGGLLTPGSDRGYPTVALQALTQPRRTKHVHRLVAQAFLGPRPAGMEVRHLNGDAGDPRLVNLRYGTRKENAQDTLLHGHNYAANRTHCPRGHEYTPDNIYTLPSRNGRFCRECRAIQAEETAARRKAEREVSGQKFWGHARVNVGPRDWRCTCGVPLGTGKNSSLAPMAAHREELRSAARSA